MILVDSMLERSRCRLHEKGKEDYVVQKWVGDMFVMEQAMCRACSIAALELDPGDEEQRHSEQQLLCLPLIEKRSS